MEALNELFAKALNIEKPWEIAKITFHEAEKRLDIHVDFPRGSVFVCPHCGSEVTAYDTTEKQWRHMNFFQYECHLVARIPRIECPNDKVIQVTIPWARKGADFTLLFESLALMLCREMPVNAVARILGENDGKLWRMVHHYVDEARRKTSYAGLKSLGIDETSMRKGHDYITLGVDMAAKKTVFVGHGKDANVIAEMKNELLEHGCNTDEIERTSIDMSPAFIRGVTEHFPKASIVFDKFHVMKILNDAVDQVRRNEVYAQIVLRRTRYLWLKNRPNLTEKEAKQLSAIESMPKLNLKTIRAFHIRENFQEIYRETSIEEFTKKLKKWYFWATHSRIPQMRDAAKTIKRHWYGVVSWYEHRISNGLLEGLNSLIQAAKAKARGYRTFETFRTIVFLLTGKLDFSKTGLPI